MNLAFILTMPSNNAWNGKWTGDGKLYCIIHSYRDGAAPLNRIGNHRHSFGDGWIANVEVKAIDDETKKEYEEVKEDNFCGYDWMVRDILQHGKIG